MKRVGLLVLFVLGLAAAGGLSAGVVGASTTTGTTTTTEPTTIASGVTISGVEVGDLTYDEAFAAVRDSFARPVTLVVPRHRLAIEPARIGRDGLRPGLGQPGADRPGGHGAQAARDPQPQRHAARTSMPSPSASTVRLWTPSCCCATCGR